MLMIIHNTTELYGHLEHVLIGPEWGIDARNLLCQALIDQR